VRSTIGYSLESNNKNLESSFVCNSSLFYLIPKKGCNFPVKYCIFAGCYFLCWYPALTQSILYEEFSS